MNTFWDNVLRVVAVIGLIAVLLLGAWGIIQLAFYIPSFFNNLGGSIGGIFNREPAAQTETLTVSIPATVTAGQPFAVNWKHTEAGKYSYQVSYACAAGLSIAAPVPTGGWSPAPCNTPFNYVGAEGTMQLAAALATSTKSATAAITVTATELESKKQVAQASANTTVNAPASATSVTKPKPATTTNKPSTYVPSGRTQNLYGVADLAVSIISARSQSGYVTVQFMVQNLGTNVSAANWSFNAILPITGGYTHPSGPQQALYPGDKIVYTLSYDGNQGAGYYNQPCNGYMFPCTPPTPTYGGPGTCNAYGPCTVPGYAAIPYNYNYNQNYSYGHTGSFTFGGQQTVSVQLDPYNQLREHNIANNYATATYLAY